MQDKFNIKARVLFLTISSTALVYLDTTAIPVTIPFIEKSFNLSIIEGMWIVNVYLLVLFALLPITGKLIELWGKTTLFPLGLIFFGLGGLVAAVSPTVDWLILGRILQGVGGAINFPMGISLIVENFPLSQRVKALGLNTGISATFLIMGPALGGFLTEYASWRFIYWVNVPIIVAGLYIASTTLPRLHKDKKDNSRSFPLLQAILWVISAITLIVTLMEGNIWGWSSLLTLSFLAVFFISTYLFVHISINSKEKLIDAVGFRNPAFDAAYLTVFLSQFLLLFPIFFPIFLQKQWDYSPSKTGILMLLFGLPTFWCAPLGGMLGDRFNSKWPAILGFFLAVPALIWLYPMTINPHFTSFIIPLLIFGSALSITRSPSLNLVIENAPKTHIDVISGLIQTNRQFGSTLGIAITTAFFHSVYTKEHSYLTVFPHFLITLLVLSLLSGLITCFIKPIRGVR